MSVVPAKIQLRRELRARWRALSDGQRAAEAELICRRMTGQDFWQPAKAVLLFAPLPDEVNLWPLLEHALAEGKIVTLPRLVADRNRYVAVPVGDLRRDLVAGAFGIREPVGSCGEFPLTKIDLAVIPGVGFDLRRNRLGRGKGYYDQLLADFGGIKCGVALDEQIVESVPVEIQDVPMDVVLTPTRVI